MGWRRAAFHAGQRPKPRPRPTETAKPTTGAHRGMWVGITVWMRSAILEPIRSWGFFLPDETSENVFKDFDLFPKHFHRP